MPKRSRLYKSQVELLSERKQSLPVEDGVRRVQELASRKVEHKYKGARPRKGFDQTVELVMHLGIDPKQADQMIRGSVSLPHGIGKTKSVIVFCEDVLAEAAKAAGALEAGG